MSENLSSLKPSHESANYALTCMKYCTDITTFIRKVRADTARVHNVPEKHDDELVGGEHFERKERYGRADVRELLLRLQREQQLERRRRAGICRRVGWRLSGTRAQHRAAQLVRRREQHVVQQALHVRRVAAAARSGARQLRQREPYSYIRRRTCKESRFICQLKCNVSRALKYGNNLQICVFNNVCNTRTSISRTKTRITKNDILRYNNKRINKYIK